MSSSYTTSKFAVRGNSVHPGYIRTPILGPIGDDVVISRIAAKRRSRPEEVTRMVLFIASDDASYSTGAEFVVAGGWSAGSPVAIYGSTAQYADRG